MKFKINKSLIFMPITIFLFVIILGAGKASAATFNYSDHLMDDVVMEDSNSMTAQDIQKFLTQEGSGLAVFSDIENCGSSSGAHYSYYAAYYSCGQSRSAAQIISDAGRAYGINPQVILATLQKEQSLVTTPNPVAGQLTFAMGYGCPDSGGCSYPGFFNQVDNATWQFKTDMELGGGNNWWGYTPASYPCGGATNYYSPGLLAGNNVTFKDGSGTAYAKFVLSNMSTATLYCYTPHAYNNPQGLYGLPTYGTTGSYYTGSYNFVYYFNQWFNVNSLILNGVKMTTITPPASNPAVGQTISYTISFTNTLSNSLTLNNIFIAGRAGSMAGPNRDYGWQGPVTLVAGATQQFTFTTIVNDSGPTFMWPVIMYNGNYIQYNNWGTTINTHMPNFTLSQPPAISSATVYAGQNVTFNALLKNNEPYPINYTGLGIPVRLNNSYNYDAGWVGPGVIAAGASITLSGTRNIDTPGAYSYWVSEYIGGTYTTIGSVNKFSSLTVAPNFSVSGLNFNTTSPVVGQNLSGSFTVTNNLPVPITISAVGVVGRLGTFSGPNRDLGWQGPFTFSPGQTLTFTGYSRTITETGTHYYWIGILYNGNYIQYNNWGSTITSVAP
jgi:hypothetical protein